MSLIRALAPADRNELTLFLEARLDTSLFLLSNLDAAGIEDRGEPLQGTYVAAFAGDRMTAVAAHYWTGMVIVQGDAGLEEAALASVARSRRALSGVLGPLALVERAVRAFGVDASRAGAERAAGADGDRRPGARPRVIQKDAPEVLYALDLDRLRVPALLGASGIACRAPHDEELEGLLVDWRIDYSVETLAADRTPALRAEARQAMAQFGRLGWVLCHDGRPVAYSTFNARTRGVAQVGGVFTPRELRGRGYGRAVVAASLLDARRDGYRRSVLFTPRDNAPARRAYASLGYEAIGDFGMMLFG